jgi:hypothetical protein
MFQDTFQSFYHILRMELGVIVQNQIYASPEMYNRSMSNVNTPGLVPGSSVALVNTSRLSTSDPQLVSMWKESVQMFNTTDRVPVMFYLRPVPRLKPLGSAITSVFVSTFAMLSTLWTIFSFIAGELARRCVGEFYPGFPSCVARYLSYLVGPENEATVKQDSYKKRGLDVQKIVIAGTRFTKRRAIHELILTQSGMPAKSVSMKRPRPKSKRGVQFLPSIVLMIIQASRSRRYVAL